MRAQFSGVNFLQYCIPQIIIILTHLVRRFFVFFRTNTYCFNESVKKMQLKEFDSSQTISCVPICLDLDRVSETMAPFTVDFLPQVSIVLHLQGMFSE